MGLERKPEMPFLATVAVGIARKRKGQGFLEDAGGGKHGKARTAMPGRGRGQGERDL